MRKRHFAAPPAMPITRQPFSFAICAATMPVAPAAPETTTVSPAIGRPISRRPKYAVTPVSPKRLRATSGSTPGGSLKSPPGAPAFSTA